MNRDLAHSIISLGHLGGGWRSGVREHADALIRSVSARSPRARRLLLASIAMACAVPATRALADEGGWRPPGYDGPLATEQVTRETSETDSATSPAAAPRHATRDDHEDVDRTRAARHRREARESDDDRDGALDRDADDHAIEDDDDDRPSPWNVALDLALGVAQVEFPAVELPDEVTAVTGQAPASRTTETLRLIASAGFGGFSFEGGLTTSLSGDDYMSWLLGIRLESSWDSPFAIAFRAAYVGRTDVAGQGARVGLGVVGRPIPLLSIYGEAWTEATTIPDGMHTTGALFSYVVAGSAGVRVALR